MRSGCIAAILISMLVVDASAQGALAGQWRFVFFDPFDRSTQLRSIELVLDLNVDRTMLTGTASMPASPGLAPDGVAAAKIEGTIDGNRILFTWAGPPSGYPHGRMARMKFAAVIDGDQMDLTMTEDDLGLVLKGKRSPQR
jgi:hypothetical protein